MHIFSQLCRAASLAATGAALAITMTALAGPAAAYQDDDSHARHYGSDHVPTAEEIEAMIPSEEELATMIPSEAELRAMIPSEAELRAMIPDHEALVANARAQALEGLREARNDVASDTDIPSDVRAEVLASLDAHIAQLGR